jgi:hypothetical protein
MTIWKLTVTETKPGAGLHTTGSAPITETLLDLTVRNSKLAASTLRALADELDPPKPSGFRALATRTGLGRDAEGFPLVNPLGRIEHLAAEPPVTGDALPELRTGEVEIHTGVGGAVLPRVVRVRRRRHDANRWPISVVVHVAARDPAGAVIPGAYRQDGVLRLSAMEAANLASVIQDMAREVVEAGMQAVADDNRDPAEREADRIRDQRISERTVAAVRAAGPVNLVTPTGAGRSTRTGVRASSRMPRAPAESHAAGLTGCSVPRGHPPWL